MAVSVKMDVDLSGFNSGIKEGQNILKGLNAEMKATEAEFKATGNAEKALEQKTKTLNSQIQVQKGIVDQAKAALAAMDKAGIEPTDAAYQKMYATMMNATAGMNEAQAALNGLGSSASNAAGQADQLTQSVQGISKKISLDQVLTGINAITTGLENAAKKAVQLGEDIWNAIMDSARWADDTATMAQMYGIDVEKFQQMQKLVAGGLDTSVEAMLRAQTKFRKGMGEGSIADTLKELRITASELKDTGGGIMEFVQKDDLQLFWEAGQAIMTMTDVYDKEAAAQKLFGRSWEDLVALFTDYKTVEEYNEALKNQTVVSEEAVKAGAELNDKIGELEDKFKTLKDSVLLSLAPELSKVADSLNGVLQSVLEYLNTPEGQEMLQSLGEAVASLFEDVKNIDPDSAIEMVKGAFDSIKSALDWIKENSGTIIGAIEGIGIAFAGLKLGEIALNVWKFVDGARTLLNMGGGGNNTPPVPTPSVTDMSLLTKAGALGLTAGVAFLPVIASGIVRKILPEEDQLFNEKHVTAADATGTDIENVLKWIELRNQMVDLNDQMMTDLDNADLGNRLEQMTEESGKLYELIKDTDLFKRYQDFVEANDGTLFGFDKLDPKVIEEMLNENPPQVQVEPAVIDGAAASISEQIGTVTVPIRLEYAGGAGVVMPMKHANGLPFVPYDGYLAMLHRGERVMTASANRSYTYNSNNYFGNVNLNNGQDIDALCTSIDRHNRRMQSGFGA